MSLALNNWDQNCNPNETFKSIASVHFIKRLIYALLYVKAKSFISHPTYNYPRMDEMLLMAGR